MAKNKRWRQSFVPENPPVITCWASVAGKKESEGPLGHCFDITSADPYWGQKTWEQGEKQMQKLALGKLLEKAGLQEADLDMVFSGDLLNQCIGSSFPLRNTGIPHLGLYGACSTMAESLVLAAMAVSGGFADRAVAMTSSHFASSERQYRFPLGYGGQRTPTAQWTVTGSGAALICNRGQGPRITACTIGTVTDLGIRDANNMGAAMAPVDVILRPYPSNRPTWLILHTNPTAASNFSPAASSRFIKPSILSSTSCAFQSAMANGRIASPTPVATRNVNKLSLYFRFLAA